jgi:hypothetical protein
VISNYIDKTIGFYFEGGFDKMIEEAHLDKEEIHKWGSIAFLYNIFVSRLKSFNETEQDDVFALVEDLYTKLEVDLEMDGRIDRSDLDDIGLGYEIDISKYRKAIESCVDYIEIHGIHLYKIINT